MQTKRGEGYVSVCVAVVIFCMLLSAMVTFCTTVSLVRVIKRNSQIVLDNYVMQNAIAIYDAVKKGKDTVGTVEADPYIVQLQEYNCLDFDGNLLYCCGADGKQRYRLTKPVLRLTQAGRLKVAAVYTMTVPLYFAGSKVTEVQVPIRIESKFSDKF